MRTYINTFDFDRDGYISEKDFAEMARRFADAYNASEERKKNLIQVFVDVWRLLAKAGDVAKGDRLTVPILVESVKQQMYYPGLMIGFNHLIRGLHELLDTSLDGYLQPDEHRSLFKNLGVPEGTFDEKFAFEAIDVNGDGKLSIDEFVAAFLDFLFSQDEGSPNKFYFGPLVD